MRIIVFLCIVYLLNGEEIRYPNVSSIHVNIKQAFGDDKLTFQIDSNGYKISLNCPSCKKVNELVISCVEGQIIKAEVIFVKDSTKVIVPINATCDNKIKTAKVINLNVQPLTNSMIIVWQVDDNSIDTYIIQYMNQTQSQYRIITTSTAHYVLDNLKEKTEYQICLATISKQFNTGKFECIQQRTDFSETGPITNVKYELSFDSIDLSWDKPEYVEDIPEGYIINYLEYGGLCNMTLTKMGSALISNEKSCSKKASYSWDSLTKLKLKELTPFTKYTVSISPINKKRTSKPSILEITTKEGESGPVSSIAASLHQNYIYISYNKPVKPNGIVIKYRIRVIQTMKSICTTSDAVVFDESDITEINKYISTDILTKCSQYRIEVSPINGCTDNEGLGQQSSIIFEYLPESTMTSLSNIEAKFISSNVVQISWEHSAINDDCPNIGFMVEITKQEEPTDCYVQILGSENCTALDNILNNETKCLKKERINALKTNNFVSNVGGEFSDSNKYDTKIWKITHAAILQSQPSKIIGATKECFTDCFTNSVYSGIRSEQDCMEWKSSRYASTQPNIRHNFCTMIKANKPWCPTKSKYEYCNIPKCSDTNQMNGCVTSVNTAPSSSSVTIKWNPPDYEGSIIGYITLLFTEDNVCLRSQLQICDSCVDEPNLGGQIKNFYITCPSAIRVTKGIPMEATFNILYQNKKHRVYIIPLLDAQTAGNIKNITFDTLLAKPVVPTNVRVINRSKSSLQFTWSSSTDLNFAGLTESYKTKLRDSNYELIKESSVTIRNVQFSNLKICSQYCFQLSAVNNAGESALSKIECKYTLAPNPANIHLDDIASEYTSSKDIYWTYKDEDNCPIGFNVEYRDIESNDLKHKNTTDRRVTIDNLKKNMIYYFKVRAETTLDTEGESKVGQYSEEKPLYTGIDKPRVYEFKDNIDVSRKRLNISWNFNASQDGSIFEIIVIIKNSTKALCLNLMNLICRSCPSPYQLKSLHDTYKLERDKLLACTKKEIDYKKDDFKFNILFEMERPLQNYTVEIHAINLIGIHMIHSTDSKYNPPNNSQSSVGAIVGVIVVMIIILVIFGVMVKMKHKPLCIYNVFVKPSAPNGNIRMQQNNRNINRVSNVKSKSLISTESNVTRTSSGPIKENVPLLEPKRKSTGIPIKEFPAYYVKMSAKENESIILEYKKMTAECKKMEKEYGLTVETGKLPVNAKKNRFINILPFDQTRVIMDGKANNYINANHIPFLGNETESEYIAAQGPIEHSIDEFWQMIMDQNINCVVMLTRTMEEDKFKCLQYWPDNVGEELSYGHNGEITVILESEVEHDGHIERNLLVRSENTKCERQIVQLHMHTWFDHSAPDLENFDKLLFRFHELTNNTVTNPYLVHCSAGVGRTGTLICIDRIIKQLVSGCQEINIYDTVFTLRHYRNFMVQRQAQYVFIHDYIHHFLKKYMKNDDVEETLYFNEE